MASIYVETGYDTGQDLMDRLCRLRPLLAGALPKRVRTLVLDSIAYLFRDMGDSVGVDQLSGRMELLFRISALLR